MNTSAAVPRAAERSYHGTTSADADATTAGRPGAALTYQEEP